MRMSDRARGMTDSGALLKLMTFLSPAFPTGAFSYSHGLEWLIDSREIRDADGLGAWLRDVLELGSGWNDAVLFAAAWRAADAEAMDELRDVALLAGALAASAERNLETMQQGRAFLAAVSTAWACDPVTALQRVDGAALPIAVAAAAAGHGIALEVALPAFLNAFVASLVSVGVRLIPIGQTAGLQVLARLHPVIASVAERAVSSTLDDLGSAVILCRHRLDAPRGAVFAGVPHMSANGPLRVGIGGPVGAGKTTLTEMLCKAMRDRYSVAVVTNDIYTKEDALILNRVQALAEERIIGVETGGCPHTAIREDASINLAAIAEMRKRFPDLDVIFIESGGDNLAATFSPELADLTIYVIDVAGGEKVPRKGGPAISRSDLLVVNKIDLAPHVGADLDVMEADTRRMRSGRPYVFADMLRRKGLERIVCFIEEYGGLG